MFLDISTGYPGSIHGARVMCNSSLYRKENRGDILSHPTKLVGQNIVCPLILGDGAYPLCDWLVKQFSQDHQLDQAETKFNELLLSRHLVF